MNKEEEDPGFRVTDKRMFRPDGELREAPVEKEPAKKESGAQQPAAKPPTPEPPPGTSPGIDFPSYILSYYTQALVFLGEVPNPMTNATELDMESAKQMVDILSMLQAKTHGNLTKEESHLLDNVLYELRMKFMAKTNRIKL